MAFLGVIFFLKIRKLLYDVEQKLIPTNINIWSIKRNIILEEIWATSN